MWRHRWDSAAGVDGNAEHADFIIDSVRTAGDVQAWTPGTVTQQMQIGTNESDADPWYGLIASIKVYDDYLVA